jgi:hypothetical protein
MPLPGPALRSAPRLYVGPARRSRDFQRNRLGEGDVLVVSRLDRPARSSRDLLNVLDEIAKA